MNLLKRIYCLFFGHRWLMCRFVWLGQKAPEEQCTRCGAWREIP